MIQHRIVNGVPTVEDVRILSEKTPEGNDADVFWTLVCEQHGDTFQDAHNAMIQCVRRERWLAWALPYVEASHADVR